MAWPQDKKPYDQFAPGTPTATALNRQTNAIGAVAQGAANVAENFGGGAGARQIGNGIARPFNALAVNNANQNRVLTPNDQLPAAQTMRPVTAKLTYPGVDSPTLGVRQPLTSANVADPRNMVDPRFTAMRKGLSGAQAIGNGQFSENAATGAVSNAVGARQGIGANVAPFGNRDAMGAVGGTIRDEQTGETISMGTNGVINRLGKDGNAIDKLSPRMWGQAGNEQARQGVLDGGETPQALAVKLGSNNMQDIQNLQVQFNPATSLEERARFAEGAARSVIQRQQPVRTVQQGRYSSYQLGAPLLADTPGLRNGNTPSQSGGAPVMPDTTGMTVNQIDAATGVYAQQRAAYESEQRNSIDSKNNDANNANQSEQNNISRLHYTNSDINQANQNIITGRNYDANNANQSEQNRIAEANGAPQRIGAGVDTQIKQLGLTKAQTDAGYGAAEANAPEADRAEIRRRRIAEAGADPQKDNFATANMTTDVNGNIVMPTIYNKATGEIVGGQQQEAPPLPENANQIKVGDVHPGPDGRVRKWDGKKWNLLVK